MDWTDGMDVGCCTSPSSLWHERAKSPSNDDDWRHAVAGPSSMFPPVSELDLDYQIYESSILLGCGCYSPQARPRPLPLGSSADKRKTITIAFANIC